ncbi:hypothetical protein FISHEDRAFT_78110 [Fistulina hepatica ATCC 64428]|nr:hypothetical protein FISHEDRAFT_78110 [Fistulina hepatica ATCC 64428]
MSHVLSSEVVDYIIDLFADDRPCLRKCSLLDRAWIPRSRYHLFKDIRLSPCRHPSDGGHCRRPCQYCFMSFSLLLNSPHSTIPRVIRTLQFNGRFFLQFGLKGDAFGGMSDPSRLLPLFRHFQVVERLELLDVSWFDPPQWMAPVVHQLLSSVRVLKLENVKFRSGPSGFETMLSNATTLQNLYAPSVSWQVGRVRTTVGSLKSLFGLAATARSFFDVVYQLSDSQFHELHALPRSPFAARRRSLHSLALDVGQCAGIIDALLAEPHTIRDVKTLMVSLSSNDDDVVCLQRLLDVAAPALEELIIRCDHPTSSSDSTPQGADLSRLDSLQCLTLHITHTPLAMLSWLRDTLLSVPANTPPALRIIFEIPVSAGGTLDGISSAPGSDVDDGDTLPPYSAHASPHAAPNVHGSGMAVLDETLCTLYAGGRLNSDFSHLNASKTSRVELHIFSTHAPANWAGARPVFLDDNTQRVLAAPTPAYLDAQAHLARVGKTARDAFWRCTAAGVLDVVPGLRAWERPSLATEFCQWMTEGR